MLNSHKYPEQHAVVPPNEEHRGSRLNHNIHIMKLKMEDSQFVYFLRLKFWDLSHNANFTPHLSESTLESQIYSSCMWCFFILLFENMLLLLLLYL